MNSITSFYRIMTALQRNDEYDYFHLQQEFQTVIKDLKGSDILKPRIILKDSKLDVMEVAFIEARGFVFKKSNEYRQLKEWLNETNKG